MSDILIHDGSKRRLTVTVSDLVPLVDIHEMVTGHKTATVTLCEDEVLDVALALLGATRGRIVGPLEHKALLVVIAAGAVLKKIRKNDEGGCGAAMFDCLESLTTLLGEIREHTAAVEAFEARAKEACLAGSKVEASVLLGELTPEGPDREAH